MPRPKLDRPNFALVRLPGREIYYIRWTENGRSKIASTGASDREEAEAERKRFEAERLRPRDGAAVGELIDHWLEARKHKPSYTKLKSIGKVAKAEFGALLPSQINEGVVARYIQRMAAKPTTCRRALEILTFATKIKTERPPKRPPRDRYMTREEAAVLLKHSERLPHLRIFIGIALQSGARHRAILGLTWDRVDLARARIDFRDPDRGETKKRRGICRIGKGMVDELKAWRPFTKEYVVEWNRQPLRDIGHAFRAVAEEAGMAWVTPHVLKHTAISWLAERGRTVDQISDFTSTSPEVVRRIYKKFSPDSLSELADDLDVFATESEKPAKGSGKPNKKSDKPDAED